MKYSYKKNIPGKMISQKTAHEAPDITANSHLSQKKSKDVLLAFWNRYLEKAPNDRMIKCPLRKKKNKN